MGGVAVGTVEIPRGVGEALAASSATRHAETSFKEKYPGFVEELAIITKELGSDFGHVDWNRSGKEPKPWKVTIYNPREQMDENFGPEVEIAAMIDLLGAPPSRKKVRVNSVVLDMGGGISVTHDSPGRRPVGAKPDYVHSMSVDRTDFGIVTRVIERSAQAYSKRKQVGPATTPDLNALLGRKK